MNETGNPWEEEEEEEERMMMNNATMVPILRSKGKPRCYSRMITIPNKKKRDAGTVGDDTRGK
jgi:hypothetical protein